MMHRQRIAPHPLRTALIRLFFSLLLAQALPTVSAQRLPPAVSVIQIPADGLLLNEGWRFRPGDSPNGASPQLDDRQWTRIDPTKDIRDLPQLHRGSVGWLRLHLTTGPNLPPTMVHVFQSIASEVYLDGRLLYRFGTVSTNPGRVQAYNPNAAFTLPLRTSSQHVLALRFACEPGLNYAQKHLRWDAAAVQLWLTPSTVLPAIRPLSVQSVYLDTFRVGISFILFILHLSLFLAYRPQRANLYAAGMYLLLSVTFWARAANNFAHSMNLRMLLHYGSLLDSWVPAMAILTFYSLFNLRIGWLFWLAISSIGLLFVPLPAEYDLLKFFFNYYLQFEIIRLSVVANQRRLLGARIVGFGAFCNLGLWITFSVLSAMRVPVGGNEWLYHTLFVVSFLCFPLTLSLRLALEHGWINRQLMDRLRDVEHLSARNLAQQQERQQLLAQQNEQLEQQVAERTQKLHQQANQLREVDQIKSRFMTNLTHEFRTPLSLILSPVKKMLHENRFDRSMLTMVDRNADQLLRLINQLLDLSKLEANFMGLSLTRGNVTDFICHVVELFQRSADQKGVMLTCSLENFPPQDCIFDADKWEKILTNLLSNSLKFTPVGGHVTVTGTPIWVTGEMTGVTVQITDSGIGITPEALPHIFDRFYQADTSSTRAYGGTGIGLALANELIGLLGGTITVESQPNVRTTFRLTLLVQPVSATTDVPIVSWSSVAQPDLVPLTVPAPDQFSNRLAANQTAPRVLIVEDNDELRDFLVDELAPSYHVLQAADGETGWELIQTELPDVVLTDVMMPRLDGYALTQLTKGHPSTDHIAVVMLTAKAAQPSRIEGLERGADDYLSKPFNMAELHLRLHNLITRQQKLGERYRQQFTLPKDTPALETEPEDDVTDPFLLRIYGLLEQHLDDTSISVDWLADQLKMNRKTLYRKAQSLIQLPPADLIRQYRLRKAAELLRAGHSVTETADLVGFNTPSHFTTVFREFYQQTPSEFMASRVG